ncbi:hypothetical protein L1987_45587 [Smallanthus sonchifolius]|uniref:Uncharacterized protein n=1 Tax=Smallanthus sonchifolius TaxID=185202 RepID=A0ACB9FYE6_9ASTR|nr:hypothetical protein L1987_45587 [Smallanthus sonchifolius]
MKKTLKIKVKSAFGGQLNETGRRKSKLEIKKSTGNRIWQCTAVQCHARSCKANSASLSSPVLPDSARERNGMASPSIHKVALEEVAHSDFPKEVTRSDVPRYSKLEISANEHGGVILSCWKTKADEVFIPIYPVPNYVRRQWISPFSTITTITLPPSPNATRTEFGIHETICYTTLEEIELLNQCAELITKPWERFFAIRDTTYYELTLEFLASFSFVRPVISLELHDCVRFRMAMHWHEISLAQFGVRVGMYRHREITQPVFTESHSEFGEGEASLFWGRIGSGPFDPHSQTSTKLKHPLHRYLHRCIVLTLGGRKDSTGVVSLRDLFHLHCLIDQVDYNLAYSLAKFFTRASGYCSSSHVFGGPFITRLASNMGVLTPARLGTLLEMNLPHTVDSQMLIRMGMLKKINRVYRLINHKGNIWTRVVEESDDDAGEGHLELGGGKENSMGYRLFTTPPRIPLCWI